MTTLFGWYLGLHEFFLVISTHPSKHTLNSLRVPKRAQYGDSRRSLKQGWFGKGLKRYEPFWHALEG